MGSRCEYEHNFWGPIDNVKNKAEAIHFMYKNRPLSSWIRLQFSVNYSWWKGAANGCFLMEEVMKVLVLQSQCSITQMKAAITAASPL
jgi:hypothetical protein